MFTNYWSRRKLCSLCNCSYDHDSKNPHFKFGKPWITFRINVQANVVSINTILLLKRYFSYQTEIHTYTRLIKRSKDMRHRQDVVSHVYRALVSCMYTPKEPTLSQHWHLSTRRRRKSFQTICRTSKLLLEVRIWLIFETVHNVIYNSYISTTPTWQLDFRTITWTYYVLLVCICPIAIEEATFIKMKTPKLMIDWQQVIYACMSAANFRRLPHTYFIHIHVHTYLQDLDLYSYSTSSIPF